MNNQKENFDKLIIVEIPACIQHEGIFIKKYAIKPICPKCGARRAITRSKGFSYDGSRRLVVDTWQNECGHIDKYSAIREEVANYGATI